MIKSFKIVSCLNEELFLDITRPQDTGFAVISVTGITDPGASISKADYTTYDGGSIGNIKVESRNIVMSIVFYLDNSAKETIEELRWKCKRYFQLKKELTFYVTDDHGTYWIKGYVESNEVNIFTKQEAAQISIICPDPYFTKEVNTTPSEYITEIVPKFEFPVSFEKENNVQKTVEFGTIKDYPEAAIDYDGDDAGVTIVLEFSGYSQNIRLNNVTRGEYMILDTERIYKITGYRVKKHDRIIINTRRGQKAIDLIRNGETINIMHSLTKDSKWIYIQKGMNQFTATAEEGQHRMKVHIEYDIRTLGV